MKNIKYHIVDKLPKSNIKIVERGKTDTGNTQAQKRSFSLLGTGTSIKSGGIKLALWTHTSPLSEMMRSCTFFPHMSKIPTLTYNRSKSVIIKNDIIFNIIHF